MIYVLIEQIRQGCECECLLSCCLYASNSREELEQRKQELETEEARVQKINVEFEGRYRESCRVLRQEQLAQRHLTGYIKKRN